MSVPRSGEGGFVPPAARVVDRRGGREPRSLYSHREHPEHQLTQEVTTMSTEEIKRRIEAMFADEDPRDVPVEQGPAAGVQTR
ncbi:hypothetical protein GCM10023094_38100 [Rhodococcus olei]|uniref:Uncharacterized protein n=1 Tax=Rhodococcus olei TaxID=2161675 RepID=A0ABP8PB78_9NOCA